MRQSQGNHQRMKFPSEEITFWVLPHSPQKDSKLQWAGNQSRVYPTLAQSQLVDAPAKLQP